MEWLGFAASSGSWLQLSAYTDLARQWYWSNWALVWLWHQPTWTSGIASIWEVNQGVLFACLCLLNSNNNSCCLELLINIAKLASTDILPLTDFWTHLQINQQCVKMPTSLLFLNVLWSFLIMDKLACKVDIWVCLNMHLKYLFTFIGKAGL